MSGNENNFSDWQPGRYLKFKGERTQPAIDLAARIEVEAPARIIDLGCGPGNSTAVLKNRWPAADVTGLDSSESMLGKARESFPEINFLQRDLSGDLSDLGTFDVVFSNAVLQWVPEIDRVIVQLFQLLPPGGALAFQIPHSTELPSHKAMYRLVKSPEWAGRFAGPVPQPEYRSVSEYYSILAELSEHLSMWETRYIQIMASHADIVEWNKGSALRPWLDALLGEELREEFLTEYDAAIREAYPVEKNGTVLYPFTRTFAVAYRT